MHKAIIDTNVFISGIIYGGNPRKIVNFWLDKKLILCLSPELKAEILNKLGKKFLLPSESLTFIEKSLDTYSLKYVPKVKLTICQDPKDNFLLELAQVARADFLITGDKDLLTLKKYKNTKIVSPGEYLQILE